MLEKALSGSRVYWSWIFALLIIIGGGVAISDNLEITDNVILAGRSNVANSITEPGMYAAVIPVIEARKWRRILGRIKQLDELAKRIKALELENK